MIAAAPVAPVDPQRLADALERATRDVDTSAALDERILRLLGTAVGWIVGVIGSVGDAVGPAGPVLLLVGLLVAVALALRWLLRRLGVVEEARSTPPGDTGTDPARLRATADRALADGDLNAALRAEYGLLVLDLARRGVIEDVPSLTPAEVRRAAAGRPGGDPVPDATKRFEGVVYGGRPATTRDVEAVRAAAGGGEVRAGGGR